MMQHIVCSTIEGKSTLEYGLMSVCSFHATKVFSTIEGGCVVTRDQNLAQKLRDFRNFGILNEDEIASVGLNGKMSEIHALIGNLNLKTIDQEIQKRMSIANLYQDQLKNIEGLLVLKKKLQETNYSYFPVLCPNKDMRQIVINKLNEVNISREILSPIIK